MTTETDLAVFPYLIKVGEKITVNGYIYHVELDDAGEVVFNKQPRLLAKAVKRAKARVAAGEPRVRGSLIPLVKEELAILRAEENNK